MSKLRWHTPPLTRAGEQPPTPAQVVRFFDIINAEVEADDPTWMNRALGIYRARTDARITAMVAAADQARAEHSAHGACTYKHLELVEELEAKSTRQLATAEGTYVVSRVRKLEVLRAGAPEAVSVCLAHLMHMLLEDDSESPFYNTSIINRLLGWALEDARAAGLLD